MGRRNGFRERKKKVTKKLIKSAVEEAMTGGVSSCTTLSENRQRSCGRLDAVGRGGKISCRGGAGFKAFDASCRPNRKRKGNPGREKSKSVTTSTARKGRRDKNASTGKTEGGRGSKDNDSQTTGPR